MNSKPKTKQKLDFHGGGSELMEAFDREQEIVYYQTFIQLDQAIWIFVCVFKKVPWFLVNLDPLGTKFIFDIQIIEQKIFSSRTDVEVVNDLVG